MKKYFLAAAFVAVGIVLKQPKWQCNGSICPT
jgi:hypothetical protein